MISNFALPADKPYVPKFVKAENDCAALIFLNFAGRSTINLDNDNEEAKKRISILLPAAAANADSAADQYGLCIGTSDY